MKNSQIYWNEKRERVELWHEEVNGKFDFWEKINGVSYPLTERKYKNRIKKYDLRNSLEIAIPI